MREDAWLYENKVPFYTGDLRIRRENYNCTQKSLSLS